jgi:hypothetical protein
MPSPVVLKVQFADAGPKLKPVANAKVIDDKTAVVTYPVDVWFPGRRTFTATLDFGSRPIERIRLDPGCRFPDKNTADNYWPRSKAPAAQAAGGGRRAPCSE